MGRRATDTTAERRRQKQRQSLEAARFQQQQEYPSSHPPGSTVDPGPYNDRIGEVSTIPASETVASITDALHGIALCSNPPVTTPERRRRVATPVDLDAIFNNTFIDDGDDSIFPEENATRHDPTGVQTIEDESEDNNGEEEDLEAESAEVEDQEGVASEESEEEDQEVSIGQESEEDALNDEDGSQANHGGELDQGEEPDEPIVSTESLISLTLNHAQFQCDCANATDPPHHPPAAPLPGVTLGELAAYREQLQYLSTEGQFPTEIPVPQPLASPTVLAHHRDHDGIPWKSILAGDAGFRNLSIAASQSEVLEAPVLDQTWDVDSVLFRITSLQAYRHGFSLIYTPSFLSRIKQSAYVLFGSHENIHLMKNVELGTGSVAQGFHCHIIFPHVPISVHGETHLTDIEQKLWIDSVILPALTETCPQSVLQHHPKSWDEVRTKSQARVESAPVGQHPRMAIAHNIPRRLLQPFWAAVQNRIRPRPGHPALTDPFRECILVVSRHNTKLLYQDPDRQTALYRFLDDITLLFDLDPLLCPDEDFWVDAAVELTPAKDSGLVLMMNTACAEHWCQSFGGTTPGKAVSSQIFHWFGVRDVASARVMFGRSHPLYRGGMAFNKIYNVQKNTYTTPIKDSSSFGHEQLESLAFSLHTLNRWQEANQPGSARNHQGQQLAAYLATKRRLVAALEASLQSVFGVRQEFRTRLSVVHRLAAHEAPVLAVENNATPRHASYWYLHSADVTAYMRSELNRWLLPLEYYMGPTIAAKTALPPEDELARSAIMLLCLRVLRIAIFEGFPEKKSSLWKRRYPIRLRAAERRRLREQGEREPGLRYGLGIGDSFAEHAMFWLPSDEALVQWNPLRLHPRRQRQTAFVANHVQAHFWHQRRQVSASTEAISDRLLRQHLQEVAPQHYVSVGPPIPLDDLRLFTELVCQTFIQDLLAAYPKAFCGLDFIPDSARRGLDGLGLEVVCQAIGTWPRLITPRGGPRHGKSIFQKLDNTWVDKIRGLFDWRCVSPQPAWNNKPFRHRVREYYRLIWETVSPEAADYWLDSIGMEARPYLMILPHYDGSHLCQQYKASKHHAETTREDIREMSAGGRMNWIACFFPVLRHDRIRVDYFDGELVQTGYWDHPGDVRERLRSSQVANLRASDIEMLQKSLPPLDRVLSQCWPLDQAREHWERVETEKDRLEQDSIVEGEVSDSDGSLWSLHPVGLT